jgi:hypothetical protein
LSKLQVSRWSCPTCNKLTKTPFCATCGEQALRTRDLTLRALLDQLFEAFTNIDGRLIRSFRYLVGRPGVLTDAYLKGQRKPYLGPVALFLICNALFFATEVLTGGHVFTTPLENHLQEQDWSEIAQTLVTRRLAAKQVTLANYTPVFDEAVAPKARSLIILMALVFSLVPVMLFMRSRRPLVAHVVFSLHLYAFLLLLLSVGTTISAIGRWSGVNLETGPGDTVLSIALLLASGVYLYFATRTVYGERGISRALKTIVMTVMVGNVVLGYRFALFIITLYST